MSTVASIVAAATHRRMPGHSSKARIFDLEVEVELAEVSARLEAARMRRHRHDLVNALAGVDGALTLVIEETLSASDRATLMEMLVSGLSHLRHLVSAGPETDQSVLNELMESLAAEPEWQDRVRADVPPDLVVAGSADEIAEAVRRLVAHSIDRSPSGEVIVRARRNSDGKRIDLWVDNHDVLPHHPPRPGWASSTRLAVAIRLAEGQGGEVRVGPGGDDSLQFSWPVPVD